MKIFPGSVSNTEYFILLQNLPKEAEVSYLLDTKYTYQQISHKSYMKGYRTAIFFLHLG